MRIILIAAIARGNRCIGKDGGLPWRIPEDLQRFKRVTTGCPLIMGRRTFDSIVEDFGGPLPNRRTVVLTRQGELASYPDIETAPSLEIALEVLSDAPVVFIGGGSEVYRTTLLAADRLELTLVDGTYEGDTFFPEYEHLIGTTFRLVNEQPRTGYAFLTYERIRPRVHSTPRSGG